MTRKTLWTTCCRTGSLGCCLLIVLACVRPSAASEAADAAIVLLPPRVQLHSAEARLSLIVHQATGETLGTQIREGLTFTSSDPSIVTIEEGRAVPQSNGTATITATSGRQTAQVPVTVSGMQAPHQWNFRIHVEPVLAKAGCSSGPCHGALAGKGGFKLSLRGYDIHSDYHTIAKQARGRRLELSDPGRSLILAKPSGAMPHKGGVRLEPGSDNYRIMASWIAAGAPGPDADDPQLERIRVYPERAQLHPGQQEQLVLLAEYSDGHIEDVTRWGKFTSANQAVAAVDEQGRVAVTGYGEGAVTAWFSSRIVTARVTSPFPNDVAEDAFEQFERRNFIDDLVLKQLRRMNVPPSGRVSDAGFLRRAFLDTIGLLPTAAEVRSFLDDERSDKRDRLIDSLLQRPEFVDYWTYKWSDVLLVNGQRLRPDAVQAYYQWIRQHVEANTPWDDFVTEVLTAQGSSIENGATNFYALHQDPESLTENACQAFLGLSIGCARCHNHPLEKWTNNQYYAMANMFARVRAKGWGGDPRNGDGHRTLYVATTGDLIQPLTGKPQPPTPLDGTPLELDDPSDRRVHLARWMTAPENPYFARAIANRIWANFFDVGLVEEVDDLRLSNPASNDELLQAIAELVVEEDFNLKALMRAILQSETYQRSSQPRPGNEEDHRFYSRYYPRRMMAEVALDAISQVTEVPSVFDHVLFPGADRRETKFYDKGTRAIQLYDSAVESYFLDTFGRNERMITCECERSDEPSMVQVLHLSNGNTINDKLSAPESRVGQLLDADLSDAERLKELYLSALARRPTQREQQQLLDLIRSADASERRQVWEDVFWSVLTSREFLFNH